MKININLFATLRNNRFESSQRQYPEASTVRHILEDLNIPESEAAIIFINGRHADFESVMKSGDTLSIFPPIGGG